MNDSVEKKKLPVVDIALSLVFIAVMTIIAYRRGVSSGGMAAVSITYTYIFLMGAWIIAARIIRRLPKGDVKSRKPIPKPKPVPQRQFSYFFVIIISLFPIIKSCKNGQDIYFNSIKSDLKPLVEAIHNFHKKNDRYPVLLAEIKENDKYPKELLFLGSGPNIKIDRQESSAIARNRIDEISFFSRIQNFKNKQTQGKRKIVYNLRDLDDFYITIPNVFSEYRYFGKLKKWSDSN